MKIYAETAVSLFIVITAIKLTQILPSLTTKWILAPVILLTTALIPKLIKKQNPFKNLLPLRNTIFSLSLLSATCIFVLPLLYISLLLLQYFPIIKPALPVAPPPGQIASWIIFQFLYVAVSEEIFFRAYLQSNILKALTPQSKATPETPQKKLSVNQWTAITISSAAFTIAHMIIHADPVAILIFLPGMIFGWLFAKTDSLIAPILFHGISNTAYYLIT